MPLLRIANIRKSRKFAKIYPLNSFLSIFSDLIFDSKVDPGIPSLAAAPDAPDTRPLHSRRAASTISFSFAASCCGSSSGTGSGPRGLRESQLSSTENVSRSATINERSMTFSKNRGVSLLDTWAALESLVDRGKCRANGLSDIALKELTSIYESARIKPAVLQAWAVQRGRALLTTPKTAAHARESFDIPALPGDAFDAINRIQTGRSSMKTGSPGFLPQGR